VFSFLKTLCLGFDKKNLFFFLAWTRPISPRRKYPSPEWKFSAWAKVVQRARSIFALAKILSPGREYLIAWAKDFSPRRKHSREHTCSRDFLAWSTVPVLKRTTFSPGRVISRLGENSPESILATRNHSRLGEMMSLGRIMQKNQQNSLYQSYHACLRWLNWVKIKPHTRWMIYPNTNYLFNRSTYHQFSYNYLIHAIFNSTFQTCMKLYQIQTVQLLQSLTSLFKT